MRKKIVFLLCLCAIIISTASATSFSITSNISNPSVLYDPDSPTTVVISATLTLQINGRIVWPESYCVLIDESSPASVSDRKLNASNSSSFLSGNFYIYDTYGNSEEVLSSQNSSNPFITLWWGHYNKTIQTYTLKFYIDRGQTVPGGSYSGSFILKIFQEGDDLNGPPDAKSKEFTYTATVNKTVAIKVGSASGNYSSSSESYNIDLDEVSQGASTNFGIFVKGNSAYTLSMKDSSGGYLTSTTTSDKIGYTLTIDGVNYPLSTSDTEILHQSTNAMYNNVYIGAINVPAGQDVEAGQYSDSVFFTVTAN